MPAPYVYVAIFVLWLVLHEKQTRFQVIGNILPPYGKSFALWVF